MSAAVQKEQLQELHKVLDGKEASLRKTYRTQTEANKQVWVLNENREKAGKIYGK